MEPLNGHEAGNGGHSQGASCTPPRRCPTRLIEALDAGARFRCGTGGGVMHAILPAASKGGVRPQWPKIRANIAATASPSGTSPPPALPPGPVRFAPGLAGTVAGPGPPAPGLRLRRRQSGRSTSYEFTRGGTSYTGTTSDRSTSMASVGRAPRSKRMVLSRARLRATCSK